MIIPLRGVVIVEVQPQHETAAGIQLLDSHKDPAGTEQGKVVSIRSSYITDAGYRVDPEVRKGDVVLFARKHGIAVKGSKTLQCVRYENLLAVIED
jgi:chaperonin GroES